MINPAIRGVMTEAEYDAERARLHDLYGDTLQEMVARRDQALAHLFARSGWTQEKLAEKEGKSQFWVSKRLLFGRFLSFIANAIKPENLPRNLTEGRFRALWSETDQNEGNERIRFQQVLKLIEDNLRVGESPHHRGYNKIIKDNFADGKWHPASEIAAAIGATEKEVRKALYDIRGTADVEQRLRGRDQHVEYRLFKKDKTVSAIELAEKLGPIIKDLKLEGKKNMATMVPAQVAMLAEKLQRLLDEWTA